MRDHTCARLGRRCVEQRRALEGEEFGARVTVDAQRRIVDGDETARRLIRDPHGQRIRFEDAAETRLARGETLVGRFEFADLVAQTRLHLLRALGRQRQGLLGTLQRFGALRGTDIERRQFDGRRRLRRGHRRGRCGGCGCDQFIDRLHQRIGLFAAGEEAFGPQFERETFVLRIVVTARVEQERNALQPLVLLPLATQGETVHARQHDVGHHGLRRLAAGSFQRFQSVGCTHDAMTARRQQLLQRQLFGLALVGNQNDTHAENSCPIRRWTRCMKRGGRRRPEGGRPGRR